MKVNTEIIEKAKCNNKVKARLCYDFNVSSQTVSRWFNNEPDGELTRVKAIKILSEELNIPEKDILTE